MEDISSGKISTKLLLFLFLSPSEDVDVDVLERIGTQRDLERNSFSC